MTAVKRATKAALAVSTINAENGVPDNDTFIIALDEEVDGSFSAKVTLSSGFAKNRDENNFKDAVSHFVLAELNL